MTLHVERMSFSRRDRDSWELGWRTRNPCATFSTLRPSFLTEIIADKASVRPKRFFGEAYVAGKWGYDEDNAWYSSYKWLTSPIWTDGKCPANERSRRFKAALLDHFPRLHELQSQAAFFASQIGFKPVAPDLWLIRRDEHWFIETKIPPDDLGEPQLAGMALIATCLVATKKVCVATVYLHEQPVRDGHLEARTQHKFEEFAEVLRSHNRRVDASTAE